jgi:hypothetical protein
MWLTTKVGYRLTDSLILGPSPIYRPFGINHLDYEITQQN